MGDWKKSEILLRRKILEQEGKAWRRQLLFFEFGMQRKHVWQSPQTDFSSSGFLNSQVTGAAWEFQGCRVSKQRELATVLSERVSIFKKFLNLATSSSGKYCQQVPSKVRPWKENRFSFLQAPLSNVQLQECQISWMQCWLWSNAIFYLSLREFSTPSLLLSLW